MSGDQSALGAFLRSRRDRLTPAQAGIAAFPGLRRVPGLRKEELAVLAGLSPDHYGRIEQGRQRTVSDELVESLSRALQRLLGEPRADARGRGRGRFLLGHCEDDLLHHRPRLVGLVRAPGVVGRRGGLGVIVHRRSDASRRPIPRPR